MQFGIFTVGDVTTDPTTNFTLTEHERIKATIAIAKKAEEVGLDVFATGEHHNPPFIPSAPTTTLAYIAAQTDRILLSTSTTLITTTDPVRIAEDYATLQHLSDGRTDLMMGRGNTGPVYPWFGKDIRDGIPLAIENYHLLHRLWREDVVNWEGKYRTPLQGFTSTPRPLDDVPPVYGHGPSLEDFTTQTPLTVGSPQQVIERTLGFRDYVGDYQRQLFLMDHAGLPLKTVLEQLDLLGEEVVPVLRKEFAALKPAHVPDAPTHQSLLAARETEVSA